MNGLRLFNLGLGLLGLGLLGLGATLALPLYCRAQSDGADEAKAAASEDLQRSPYPSGNTLKYRFLNGDTQQGYQGIKEPEGEGTWINWRNGRKFKWFRDPKQKTVFFSDGDWSLYLDATKYHLSLLPDAGIPLLGRMSNLPQKPTASIWEYEGQDNPNKLKDLIGSFDGMKPRPHGAFELYTNSDGVTFIPGYYALDPYTGMQEFRPPESGNPKDGAFYQSILRFYREGKPFLGDAAPFVATTYSKKYRDQTILRMASAVGRQSAEQKLGVDEIARREGWGKRAHPEKAFVTLANLYEWGQFGESKAKLLQADFMSLSRVPMKNHRVPHFMVVLEDHLKYLEEEEALLKILAGKALLSSPVVPILVNLAPDAIFQEPVRRDWSQSTLESHKVMSRVKIFWPGDVVPETSNEYSRVFELAFGLSPKKAAALYHSYDSPMRCNHTLEGRNPANPWGNGLKGASS